MLRKSLERNVLLYPWYSGVLHAYFWLPVFFLYFNSHFSLSNVLRLEAIYYIAFISFEVPSGYFSDVFGRRKTLLIANASIVCAHCLFFLGSDFFVFVLAQVSLALGFAFNSGTDTSLHYESVAGLGNQSEFADREAKVVRNTFVAGAVAAIVGGGIAYIDLRFAYGLSIVSGLVSLAIVAAMMEPATNETEDSTNIGFVHQLYLCARLLRQPALLWLFCFSVMMVVLNHVPYEFYQPYIALQSDALGISTASTPAVSGTITAITMLVASIAAAKSVWMRNRVGLANALLLTMVFQTIIIMTMGLILHPIVLGLILLRSCPRALMTAPLNAAVAPEIPQRRRATFLSFQSLVGRLAFSGVLVLFSFIETSNDPAGDKSIFPYLQIAALVGVGGISLLGVTSKVLRKSTGSDA